MKSHEFEAHVKYLLSKGYNRDELNRMTLGEILSLSLRLIELEKVKVCKEV